MRSAPSRPAVLSIFTAALSLFSGTLQAADATTTPAQLVQVRRIWDRAPHNGFTDLALYKGAFYCAFREGAGHVSPGGAVCVLRSTDGTSWTEQGRFSLPDHDFRDARFTETPGSGLVLQSGATIGAGGKGGHGTWTWSSLDGTSWTSRGRVADQGLWLWRTAWSRGTGYAVGYVTKHGPDHIQLFQTKDGVDYTTATGPIHDAGNPSEACLTFDADGTAHALVRRDSGSKSTLLGTASAPYTNWTWKDTGVQIGGPALLRLPDGRLVAAGRLYDGGTRTSLLLVDEKEGKMTEILRLPSGGDTGYPGLVWHDGHLWISYYASHEGKAAIYLTKVRL